MTTDWKALCAELAKVLAEEYGVQREFDSGEPLLGSGAIELLSRTRAFLSQPEPEGVTDEDRIKAAFAMGQTGAPSSETERLAFESWMRGHSWLVEGVWNGTTYDDRGPSRVSSVDVGAMQTRMLWATWRDRAALARWGRLSIEPEPEGLTDEELHDLWLELYGFHPDGPTSGDVAVIARAVLARWGRPTTPTETP